MLKPLRSITVQTPAAVTFLNPLWLKTRRVGSIITNKQTVRDSTPSSNKMNVKEEHAEYIIRDTMASLGEAYVTRSEEEGFGGIYCKEKYFAKDDDDDNTSVQDKDHELGQKKQGTEVEDKDKAKAKA